MKNHNDHNVENICGYTVHSYYVEAPHAPEKQRKKNVVLRYLAFAMLAPFAFFADAVVSIFR